MEPSFNLLLTDNKYLKRYDRRENAVFALCARRERAVNTL